MLMVTATMEHTMIMNTGMGMGMDTVVIHETRVMSLVNIV
jgi:hypothetical protein